ncbi:MAG: hypothetical protein KME08_13875 [Aphanothece sp. CMT-3BRIN-NPC111]|jgi:hypothetical protein|nr:hypothetical protein [Aphanothece sp. CMT-3BRIN-NPC111]
MAADNADAPAIVTELSEEAKLKMKITDSLMEPCDRHKLSLLSECPNCGAMFKVTALWADRWYHRCFINFAELDKYQKNLLR